MLRLSLSLYICLVHIHNPLVQALVEEDTLNPLSFLSSKIQFKRKLLPVQYLPTILQTATFPYTSESLSIVS